MARSFGSIAAFVAHLAGMEGTLQASERAGQEAAGAMLETAAKAMIGQEQEAWPPLADSTVTRKEALGQTGRVSATDPLLATGEMRDTIGHSVEGDAVVLGSTSPLAVFHEYGTSRMPPRPFIGAAMFQHGHEAADAIAGRVVAAVAGAPGKAKP